MESSRNLAVKLQPQTWEDIVGQDDAIRRMKHWLSSNVHPYFSILSGPSGTGKGSLVNVYLKALFCHNRQAGEHNPCGNCPSCKQDPRGKGATNNIIWVQKGKDDTVTKQFNSAIQEAHMPPYGNAEEEHRYWKVIVIDELQFVSTDNIHVLMYDTEFPRLVKRNNLIFIAITMNENKIALKDSELAKALKGRANGYISVNKVSEPCLYAYLSKNFPELTHSSKVMLSKHADGSVREVVRLLECAYSYAPVLSAEIISQVLKFPPPELRAKFWELLQTPLTKSSTNLTKSLKETWKLLSCNTDSITALKVLLDDIDESQSLGFYSDDQLPCITLMTQYISRPIYDCWHLIKQFRGRKLVDNTIFNVSEADGSSLISNLINN